MCLLCVRQPGADVNVQYLRNANCNNSDGSGYAILRSDMSAIDVFRSMDGEETIHNYMKAIDKDPECWAMYHARFSTHGTNSVDNVHPFKVGGSKNTVLAHNGILPVSIKPGSKHSDTRVFAERVLPAMGLGILDDRHAFAALEQWCAGSKVALFSLDNRLNNNIYIVNEHLGHWENGTWWSNNGYKFSWSYMKDVDRVHGVTTIGNPPSDIGDESIYETKCTICKYAYDDDDYNLGMCLSCGQCMECFEFVDDDCICHVPERKGMNFSQLAISKFAFDSND